MEHLLRTTYAVTHSRLQFRHGELEYDDTDDDVYNLRMTFTRYHILGSLASATCVCVCTCVAMCVFTSAYSWMQTYGRPGMCGCDYVDAVQRGTFIREKKKETGEKEKIACHRLFDS
jgi:hypothetical protein